MIWIRLGTLKSANADWLLGSLLRSTKCWETDTILDATVKTFQIRSFLEALPWLVKLVTSPAVSIVATKFPDCCYCFSSLEIARLNSEISWAEIGGNVRDRPSRWRNNVWKATATPGTGRYSILFTLPTKLESNFCKIFNTKYHFSCEYQHIKNRTLSTFEHMNSVGGRK